MDEMNSSAKSSAFSSPIYTEIENTLNNDYESIGSDLANQTLLNHSFGGGVKNYRGFTWSKPFANFAIHIRRTVAPDLFSSKWITKDHLTIRIKAHTLISNFENEGLLEIDSDTLAAFAGLEFNRKFEVSTLVDSYKAGIKLDFKSLFFAFKSFKLKSLFQMQEGQHIKKTDTLSFNTGAVANIPLTYGVELNTAVIGKYSLINFISATSKENELIVTAQKEKKIKVGLSAALEIDFFNLLKISLLSYELNYELGQSNKVSISLGNLRKEEILNSPFELQELQKIIEGDMNVTNFQRDIASIQNSESNNLTHQYELFLFGKESAKRTESFFISNKEASKKFYRHTNTSKTYQQTILSKFFKNLFGITSIKSELTKTLSLEFEKQYEQSDDVRGSEHFSFSISHDYFAKSLKRKKNRNRSERFLKYWTQFDKKIPHAINKKQIIGPIKISSNLSFKKKALDYFLNLDLVSIGNKIIQFCSSKKRSSRCSKKINSSYDKLYNNNKAHTTINMELFRSFVSMIYNYSTKIEDFEIFFNKNNIEMNGSIDARTSKGRSFTSYFRHGQIKSSGVINAFFQM